MKTIDYTDNVLDSRDLASRLEELQGLKEAFDVAKATAAEVQKAQRENFLSKTPNWAEKKEELDTQWLEAEECFAIAQEEFGDDEATELADLESAESEISEWRDGNTLVADSYFKDYARELAEECAPSREVAKALEQWPYRCIDWEKAADELKYDYSQITIQGQDFWYRNC